MTTSEIGNSGFTLIEVLLSVAMLAMGLTFILGGYNTMLEAYGRARFIAGGSMILQQKMADSQLAIKSGLKASGSENGKEGDWQWKETVTEIQTGKVYELGVEVFKGNREKKIGAETYVRK